MEKIKNSIVSVLDLFRKYVRTELILLLVLGVLVGVAVKVEASKHITMGFNDYVIAENKQSFDFEKMARDLAQEQEESGGVATPGGGASCGQ